LKKPGQFLFALAIVTSFASSAFAGFPASSHVPVGSWVYPALERLEAEGFIKSALLSSRPLTRSEASRLVAEAEENMRDADPGVRSLILRLRAFLGGEMEEEKTTYVRPLASARGSYAYASGAPHTLNYNNRGKDIESGSNFTAGFELDGRIARNYSFYLSPQLRHPDAGSPGEETTAELLEGYFSLTFSNIELTIGRESMWWGPGDHGALLISSNAKPFDMLRLANTEPVKLPWILGRLGPFRGTLFLTRLEKARDLANPYLAGLRFDFKPFPSLSVGLSRVAMFGGGGRAVDLGTVKDAFFNPNEDSVSDPNNQLAAVDLKLIVPWSFQPFVVYGEVGGEDEAGYLPTDLGYIAGIYLPRLAGIAWLALRGEYADNYINDSPGVWYSHGVYTDGYRYKGEIIGHHMGSDARDLYIEASLDAGRAGAFTLAVDSETAGAAGEVKRRNGSAILAWEKPFAAGPAISAGYAFDRRENVDGVDGSDSESHLLWAAFEHRF